MDSAKQRREEIRERVLELQRTIWNAEQEIRRAYEALHQVRRECPHDGESIFHPDASGNNGSWHECRICGGEA